MQITVSRKCLAEENLGEFGESLVVGQILPATVCCYTVYFVSKW